MSMGGPGGGLMRMHRRAVGAFILAAVLAVAWAVYVFLWFVGMAQTSNLVPSTLGLWTTGNLVSFIIYAVLWELLLVGIPVAVVAFAAWRWWKRLPEDERSRYHFGGRSGSAGGGVSFLFFLAFCLKVYLDGNWNTPIANFTLYYVVGSVFTILVWAAVIIGVPLAIGLAWWISRRPSA